MYLKQLEREGGDGGGERGGGVVLEILQAGFLSGARHTDHSIRSAGLSHRWCYLNSGLSVLHCPEKVPWYTGTYLQYVASPQI